MLNAKIVEIKEIPFKAIEIVCDCNANQWSLWATDLGIDDKKRLFLFCPICHKSREIKQKKVKTK